MRVTSVLLTLLIALYMMLSLQDRTQASTVQVGIKSWFNSTEKTSDSDSSIRRTRRNAITNAISEVSPSVVCISVSTLEKANHQTYQEYFLKAEQEASLIKTGSGFIISDDGKIVTNAHNLTDKRKKIIVTMSSGMSYITEILGVDKGTNIAVLKIISTESKVFKAATLGNSDDLMVGEWTIAMGNPFGLMEEGNPTVNVGVLSATGRNLQADDSRYGPNYMDVLQTDAEIDPVNSGGPLINSNGTVIGLNTYIPPHSRDQDGGLHGMQFAIPINRVKQIAKVLESPNKLPLGFDPGFEYEFVRTAPDRLKMEITVSGLLVKTVNQDGPAYDSGIMPGDVIVKLGNTYIQSATHAHAVLLNYKPGDIIPVEMVREQKKYRTMMKVLPKIKSNDGP